jgi:hypothetical protein
LSPPDFYFNSHLYSQFKLLGVSFSVARIFTPPLPVRGQLWPPVLREYTLPHTLPCCLQIFATFHRLPTQKKHLAAHRPHDRPNETMPPWNTPVIYRGWGWGWLGAKSERCIRQSGTVVGCKSTPTAQYHFGARCSIRCSISNQVFNEVKHILVLWFRAFSITPARSSYVTAKTSMTSAGDRRRHGHSALFASRFGSWFAGVLAAALLQ